MIKIYFFFDCIFDFDFPISSNFVNCLKSSTLITKNINSITKHPNLLDPYPTPTPPFSPSSVFSASKPFTESEMRTQTFKPTNSFQPTDIFKPTNPFTPSHSFTSSFPFRTPVTQFGLLSDADVKSSNGKWGELTTTQKVVTLTANAGVISGIVVAFLCYLKAKWKQLMRKVNSDDFENMVDESEASDSSYSYYVYSYSTSSSDKDDEFYEKEELMILCDNELKFLYETPYL
ncbi:hypothetical protein TRFO_34088 [Tritrichomonas foetus]|uniref:Uncharacterized protein n=1 Tax=Tritrichomonas foetus TaxID=1144522 RepID=A0A1J4JJS8_9EUKA|nr:hypothetical protein TRFO_34088 [Tritrichomonas foetus]|eukprot:OHS99418.1 hypothetical protein TRFO_34088 [Tritrichomonas foetus]